ncbi:MAG: hypothetical protein IIY72_08745 [Solobacterium sp.]|nr:hypothetical protein [Solobacterium sp.]MBQ1320784.1 hypothetical protein [Solobacterium sp.]MBQ1356554.1 hypothetical protein [Solobacterium sp.]
MKMPWYRYRNGFISTLFLAAFLFLSQVVMLALTNMQYRLTAAENLQTILKQTKTEVTITSVLQCEVRNERSELTRISIGDIYASVRYDGDTIFVNVSEPVAEVLVYECRRGYLYDYSVSR